MQTAYGEDGYDVMRVEFPDAQKSEQIFGVSGAQQIALARDPVKGESICFSGAKTNTVVCGTVQDDLRNWISETCDCTVWGGDASWSPIPGDSGAPAYARTYITGGAYWLNTPLGIVDHQNGGFAWVTAAEWVFGVKVYH